MLIHICCSVDSHFFLQKLKEAYPDETLIGFFYNPNIHPYSEYQLRLLDVQRSCNKLGIKLLVGEYENENWIKIVAGYEDEPEKGKRCDICFDNRLEVSAKKAKELNLKKLTTTLFASPKKTIKQLELSLEKIGAKFNLEILMPNFRINGGTGAQFLLAKKEHLYHQNYCGCLFALKEQRSRQKIVASELMSPVANEILPGSIEERIGLYSEILKCEKNSKNFTLKRQRFLNYRLLRGVVRDENKKTIPSFFLSYSITKKIYTKTKITDHEEILFLSLLELNKFLQTKYKTVKELVFNPPSIEKQLSFRSLHEGNIFSLTPIIILDKVENIKCEVLCDAITYNDVREVLAIF